MSKVDIKKSSLKNKNLLFLISIIISFILYILIGYDDYINKTNSPLESSYVIDDLNIEILYDKENYEVSAVLNKPYAIISGDSLSINKLKLSKKYKFYIDARNLKAGNYDVYVESKGIPKDLKVEIYPMVTEVFIREKSIVNYTPIIDIEGSDSLIKKDLMVGIPEITSKSKTVRIRETQENLNLIGSIKGKVNVSNFVSDKTVDVDLFVYDKEGNLMNNINLLDKKISVKIPIEKKVTVVNEIIKEEKIIDGNSDEIDKKTLELNNLLKEYNLLETKLKSLESENLSLKNKLKSLNESSISDKKSYDKKIEDLNGRIEVLEKDKADLLTEISKLKSGVNLNYDLSN